MSRALRVGYLARYVPSPSETFVWDEALALRDLGAEIVPIGLDRMPHGVSHQRFAELHRRMTWVPRSSNPATTYASFVMDSHSVMPMLRAHWISVARPRDMRRATWLARRLRGSAIDVLRVHHAAEIARYGAVAALLAGVPMSLAVHGRDLFVPTSDFHWLLNQASHISTITHFHRERLLRTGLPSEQVTLLPCAVEVPDAVADPPEDGPLRVLSVGRLVEKKGHDLLIDACARLADRGKEVQLVIVGEGQEGLQLRQRAAARVRSGTGRLSIEFWGAAPVETVHDLMLRGRFHCFALACRVADDGDRDGLPVALLEAQARGLATVTSALPGFEAAFQDDRDGLLLPLGGGRRGGDARAPDTKSLAAAIACLQDVPVLRERLARGAREQAEQRMTPRQVGERLLASLARLVVGRVYDARPSEDR